MHMSVRAFAVACTVATLAAPAIGQRPPPPPYTPHPVLSADLGLGGTGGFSAVLDTDAGQLCYMINAAGVQGATGAMITQGKAMSPVVQLAPPTGGSSGGCLTIDKDLARKLVSDPDDYMVEVASATYPGGLAAHGPLKAQIPDKPVG